MPHKFFVNTLESKFIKSLLRNTPLPIYNTVNVGSYLHKDNIYLYNRDLIKCTQEGYLEKNLYREPEELSEDLIATFEVIKDQINLNDKSSRTFVENYTSLYNFYDSATHKYLGKYLRYLRDSYGVNLLPFYNCFNYTVFDDFHLNSSGVVLSRDESKKVFAIPIKFNTKYTIAINSSESLMIKPVFYGNTGLLLNIPKELGGKYLFENIYSFEVNGVSYLESVDDELSSPVGMVAGSTFDKPFTVIVNNKSFSGFDASKLQPYEKYLYLVVQTSSANNSSITVLEGDYTKKGDYIVDVNSLDSVPSIELDKWFTSKLSLLSINDGTTYAFSDRLIEYLTLNVICPLDTIPRNVKWAKEVYSENYHYTLGKYKNEWDNSIRGVLYNKYMNTMDNRITSDIDILGYIDKDIEKALIDGTLANKEDSK